MTDNSKGASLLHYGINYSRKKFYDTGPLYRKHETKLTRLTRDKHSTLLVTFPKDQVSTRSGSMGFPNLKVLP
jgi:hypothetical protein